MQEIKLKNVIIKIMSFVYLILCFVIGICVYVVGLVTDIANAGYAGVFVRCIVVGG